MAMSPKYAEVKYEQATGRIQGLSNLGLEGHAVDCRFIAGIQLFAIDLAMMLEGNTGAFMKLADGYGAPGFFPGGYDWSGIRDSSDLARAKMFVLAVLTLDSHFDKLAEIGLPAELILDLIDQDTVRAAWLITKLRAEEASSGAKE